MNKKTSLKLNWIDYKSSLFAVKHWHYSRSMPTGKLVRIGVWEDNIFIGAVIYGMGANRHIGNEFGFKKFEACELVRVALNKHKTPVTKIISISIKLLKQQSPGLKIIISYADENQKHLGIIYQAGNWIYTGRFANERGVLINGKLTHRRTINSRYGNSSIEYLQKKVDSKAKVIKGESKNKYVMPLEKASRMILEKYKQEYPKQLCAGNIAGDVTDNQSVQGGSSPTPAL